MGVALDNMGDNGVILVVTDAGTHQRDLEESIKEKAAAKNIKIFIMFYPKCHSKKYCGESMPAYESISEGRIFNGSDFDNENFFESVLNTVQNPCENDTRTTTEESIATTTTEAEETTTEAETTTTTDTNEQNQCSFIEDPDTKARCETGLEETTAATTEATTAETTASTTEPTTAPTTAATTTPTTAATTTPTTAAAVPATTTPFVNQCLP